MYYKQFPNFRKSDSVYKDACKVKSAAFGRLMSIDFIFIISFMNYNFVYKTL